MFLTLMVKLKLCTGWLSASMPWQWPALPSHILLDDSEAIYQASHKGKTCPKQLSLLVITIERVNSLK